MCYLEDNDVVTSSGETCLLINLCDTDNEISEAIIAMKYIGEADYRVVPCKHLKEIVT